MVSRTISRLLGSFKPKSLRSDRIRPGNYRIMQSPNALSPVSVSSTTKSIRLTYRQCQSRTQHHKRHNNRRNLPRDTDMFTLMTLGPEQIEEERRPKYKRDRDSNEDIIRGRADEAVIVDFHTGVLALDFALLVEVVCKGGGS